MGICYPSYEFIATGGAIGNALFFFASGFTLYIGRMASFPDFYKRRITRIYPAVIAMSLISCLIWKSENTFLESLINYWFINCIMVYYAILWVSRRLKFKLPYLIYAALIFTGVIFTLFYDFNAPTLIYGSSQFRVFIYFPIMVLGAYMGIHRTRYKSNRFSLIILPVCIIFWYAVNHFFHYSALQLLSIPLLIVICYYTYILTKSEIIIRLMINRTAKAIICVCGGLCLEVYLIQFSIITPWFNSIFPFNIPIVILLCILAGYLLNILSKFFSQTFDSKPYNWVILIKPYQTC